MAKKNKAIFEINSFFSRMTAHLPSFATFEKVLEEFLEHKSFAVWVFIRIVIPVLVFHALLNLIIFEQFRLSPVIFGVGIFFYSTFLIDLDAFFSKKKRSKEASFVQRGLILMFAPLVIYYMLSKKMRPVHLPQKYFHRKKSMWLFALFAFVVGYLVFFNLPDALFFGLLALLGYATHLVVDQIIKF